MPEREAVSLVTAEFGGRVPESEAVSVVTAEFGGRVPESEAVSVVTAGFGGRIRRKGAGKGGWKCIYGRNWRKGAGKGAAITAEFGGKVPESEARSAVRRYHPNNRVLLLTIAFSYCQTRYTTTLLCVWFRSFLH